MRLGSFLHRTAAAALGVLVALSIVHKATAAPPGAILTAIAPAGPPSIDEARELQGAGDWDEAAEAWHAIAEAEPENGTAWFNLGYCLHAGGHLDKAIKVHQKAASFDEYRGIALYNLGCAYALSGRSDDAFEALFASTAEGFDVAGNVEGDSDLESLRDDGRFAALLESGRARGGGGGMGGPGNSIEQIVMGIQQFLEEQLPNIQRQIEMIVHQAMEQVHQMLGELQQRMAQDERFSMIAEQLGEMFGGEAHGGHDRPMNRDIHEIEDLEEMGEPPIIELRLDEPPSSRPQSSPPQSSPPQAESSGDFDKLLQRARTLQNGSKWLDAAAAYEAAIKANPESAAACFGRAYCLHMGKDYEKAIVAHRRAASFEEIRGVALYNLACASAILGKLDDAMMALNSARRAGFDLADPIANDSDLDNLRDDPRFQKLLAELDVDY